MGPMCQRVLFQNRRLSFLALSLSVCAHVIVLTSIMLVNQPMVANSAPKLLAVYPVYVRSSNARSNQLERKGRLGARSARSISQATTLNDSVTAVSTGDTNLTASEIIDIVFIDAVAENEYNVKPRYPESSRQAREEGIVVLKAEVTDTGTVESESLISSSGHPALDASAQSAIKRWRYKPATQNGHPVHSSREVRVTYNLTTIVNSSDSAAIQVVD